MKTNSQGSILSIVMMSTLFVAIVAASLISLINTQRRISLQRELQLQANSAAETALDYAYAYIINDIEQNTLGGASSVPATGSRTFTLSTEVREFILGSTTMPSGTVGLPGNIKLEDLEVKVLALQPPDPSEPSKKSKRYFVDGNDPANASDSNKNQWVDESLIPIVAKVTARQGSQSHTAVVHKGVSSREIALFQYSIFFQGQLHLHRGFRPMGGVHANGNLFLNAHNGDSTIYNGDVTTASNFYRGSTFDQTGSGADSFGYTPVDPDGKLDFTIAGVNPVATGGSGQIKIYTETSGGTHTYVNVANNMDSRLTTWKDDATRAFKGHLQDKAHLVPNLTPVGSDGYRQDVKRTSTANEFINAPYSLIEPNLPVGHGSHKNSLENSLQAKASLIFIVEYNDATTRAMLNLTDNGTYANYTNSLLPTSAGNSNAKEDFLIDPDQMNGTGGSEPRVANPWKSFVVRAYKVNPSWSRTLGTDIHSYLTPVPLPRGVIGAASSSTASTPVLSTNTGFTQKQVSYIVQDGVFEDFDISLSQYSTNAYLGAGSTQIGLIPALSSDVPAGARAKLNHNDQRVEITKGLFDSRLGRPIIPLTIDIAALKYILEARVTTLTDPTHIAFRNAFDPTENIGSATAPITRWNGLVYVEFPTSLKLQDARSAGTAAPVGDAVGGYSRRFAYGDRETRHPDRWFSHDHDTLRGPRSDNIVPMAPELRDYPDANHVTQRSPLVKISASDYGKTSTILNQRYAIPALQIINGRELPNPNPSKPEEGFTIATNAPVFLVGNYNSDGDYNTGSNITSTAPNAFSEKDTAIKEIPAAIFCDTFTILSNGWGETPSGVGLSNRQRSFYGANAASEGSEPESTSRVGRPPGRPVRARADFVHPFAKKTDGTSVTFPATNRYIEMSACVATGEYPIFEFFTHALELWSGTGAPTPIIVKGSMVGMFHSEIQHIKQAYGRDVNRDIQVYYQQHGSNCFVSSRYHRMLYEGDFPPGTPMAYVTSPREFRLLRAGRVEDDALISTAFAP